MLFVNMWKKKEIWKFGKLKGTSTYYCTDTIHLYYKLYYSETTSGFNKSVIYVYMFN